MSQHAKLSPSAGKRWINCPKSVQLSQSFENKESEYAAEGTLCHAVGELILRKRLGYTQPLAFLRRMEELQKDPLYSKELDNYATEYADYVMERFAHAKNISESAVIYIETKVTIDVISGDCWGTVDIQIIYPGVLEIIDLKYGKGVAISAEENEQQMLYALGCLEKFQIAFEIKKVLITIYQPRIHNTNHWETTADYIYTWGESVALPAALQALKGGGEYKAGSHCQFCPAKVKCRALADYNADLAVDVFKSADLLSDDEIANILHKKTVFTGWIAAIEAYALEEAKKGKPLPGFKLVAGKSARKYTDPGAVLQILKDNFYDLPEIAEIAPLPITKMEAFLGPKLFKQYLSTYTVKQKGAPTLVPISDKRPAKGSDEAADIFAKY